MISEKMNQAFNKQIKDEMYSSNLYLSMVAYFEEVGLKGFANWMRIQVQEENAHAMGLFDYLIERDGRVIVEAIDKPETCRDDEWIVRELKERVMKLREEPNVAPKYEPNPNAL